MGFYKGFKAVESSYRSLMIQCCNKMILCFCVHGKREDCHKGNGK